MNVLVVMDHEAGKLRKVSLEMLSAARSLGGGEVWAAYLGAGYADHKAAIAEVGPDKVFVCEDAAISDFLARPSVDVLAQVVADSSPDAILVASTPGGKDLAGRLCARLGVGVVVDAVGLEADGDRFVATKAVFGGAMVSKSRCTSSPQVITVKPNSFGVENGAGGATEVTLDGSAIQESSKQVKILETVVQASGRPAVDEAGVIVSGGRGLGGPENFKVVEELADVLGAAVGASRAAVDAGWYPHQNQVGQTGKTVSPNLYIACGISGAIQHRAGMQTSKNIVAVNKDPEAPIFGLADFGVVGARFKVVPALPEARQKRKG